MEFLIVIKPASGGRYEHRVAPGSYVLGREEASCDIAILSPEVSGQHARIHLSAGQCTIEDLGSTAGTSKDGQALKGKQSFPFPTEVMLGTTKLTVSVDKAVEMTFDSGSVGTPTANPSSAISFNQGQPSSPKPSADVGHFTKGREIARGGMGAILKANDRMLGRTVAMKVVLEDRASEDARMRFIREATVLGQLEHPNIIPIHELGKDDDGNLFYTMKMVEGRTLQAIINDLKKGDCKTIEEFSLDRLLTVFRKVCDAIAFAHSKGIVHRDLKPENVMVGAFGEVLVMDWGLAKILNDAAQTADELGQQQQLLANSDAPASESVLLAGFQELPDSQMRGSSEDLTMDGAVMGSPQYMPPEQAEGRIADIDEKSDIYSLGGILYAILTLRPPIKGKTVNQVLENVKSGNITPPTEYNPESSTAAKGNATKEVVADSPAAIALPHCPGGKVPSALSSVSMKALSSEPETRFGSVGELAHDVEQWQGGFATSAESISLLGMFRLWLARNKAIATLSLAAVFTLALVSSGFMFKVNAEKQAAVAAEAQQKVEADNARAAEKVAKASLARSYISLAEAAYRAPDMNGMSRALSDCPSEFRDHTWHYLAASKDSSIGVFNFPQLKNLQAARAVPGRPGHFVLAGEDQEIFIKNVAANTAAGSLDSNIPGRKVLSVSGDGQTLAVGGRSGTELKVLDLKTGKVFREFKAEGTGIHSISLNHDGSLLAVGYLDGRRSGGLQVFDPKQGRMICSTGGLGGAVVILHPTEDILMTGSMVTRKVHLHSARDGKEFFSLRCEFQCMALSQDGDRLAVGSMVGGVSILDSRTGTKLQDGILHTSLVTDLAWTAENTLVTVGDEGSAWRIGVWDANNFLALGSMFGLIEASAHMPVELHLDPASGFLLTIAPQVQLWSVPVDLEVCKLRHAGERGVSGCFISDSILVASRAWTTAAFDVSNPATPRNMGPRFPGGLAVAASHWKTERFAAGRYWDNKGALNLFEIKDSRPSVRWSRSTGMRTKGLDFDPAGRRLLMTDDARMKIFAVADGTLLKTIDRKGYFFVGEGGERIMGFGAAVKTSQGSGYRVELLDSRSGQSLLAITNRIGPTSWAVSTDRKLAAVAGTDFAVDILDTRTLERRIRFRAHDKGIGALAFHPIEPVIASAASDGTIKLWDLTTGRLLRQFFGIRGAPASLAFSPSGHLLSVDGRESVVRVFDTSRLEDLSIDRLAELYREISPDVTRAQEPLGK